MKETPTADYLQGTEWNVRDSDGTVIFTLSEELTGGSKRTAEFAEKHKKPWIHLNGTEKSEPAGTLKDFIEKNQIRVLNVAGSRATNRDGKTPTSKAMGADQ